MRRWRRRCRLRRRRRVSRGSGGRDLTAWSYRDMVPKKDGNRDRKVQDTRVGR